MIFYSVKEAAQYVNSFSHKTIGVTSGCFDLIHPLHIDYLNKCKRQCDYLIVLVDTDRLSAENKNKVPLINELDRAYMLDNLNSTHVISLMDKLDDFILFLQLVSPAYSIPNGDNKILLFKHSNTIYNENVIMVNGVELFIVPDVNRFNSTTDIINFLKQ